MAEIRRLSRSVFFHDMQPFHGTKMARGGQARKDR
jgi:hypothetical protein